MDTTSMLEMMQAVERLQRMLQELDATTSALEEWRRLAERDPQAFERLRGQYLGHLIDSAHPHVRTPLCALQRRLDAPRHADGSTDTSCRRMEDEAVQLRAALEHVRRHIEELETPRSGES